MEKFQLPSLDPDEIKSILTDAGCYSAFYRGKNVVSKAERSAAGDRLLRKVDELNVEIQMWERKLNVQAKNWSIVSALLLPSGDVSLVFPSLPRSSSSPSFSLLYGSSSSPSSVSSSSSSCSSSSSSSDSESYEDELFSLTIHQRIVEHFCPALLEESKVQLKSREKEVEEQIDLRHLFPGKKHLHLFTSKESIEWIFKWIYANSFSPPRDGREALLILRTACLLGINDLIRLFASNFLVKSYFTKETIFGFTEICFSLLFAEERRKEEEGGEEEGEEFSFLSERNFAKFLEKKRHFFLFKCEQVNEELRREGRKEGESWRAVWLFCLSFFGESLKEWKEKEMIEFSSFIKTIEEIFFIINSFMNKDNEKKEVEKQKTKKEVNRTEECFIQLLTSWAAFGNFGPVKNFYEIQQYILAKTKGKERKEGDKEVWKKIYSLIKNVEKTDGEERKVNLTICEEMKDLEVESFSSFPSSLPAFVQRDLEKELSKEGRKEEEEKASVEEKESQVVPLSSPVASSLFDGEKKEEGKVQEREKRKEGKKEEKKEVKRKEKKRKFQKEAEVFTSAVLSSLVLKMAEKVKERNEEKEGTDESEAKREGRIDPESLRELKEDPLFSKTSLGEGIQSKRRRKRKK